MFRMLYGIDSELPFIQYQKHFHRHFRLVYCYKNYPDKACHDIWSVEAITAAVWARLAEINIRIIFIAMTFIASLVFEEVDEEINYLEELSTDNIDKGDSLLPKLKEMMSHYNMAFKLVEKINQCFALILLIVTVTDFSTAIHKVYQLFISLRRAGNLEMHDNFMHDHREFSDDLLVGSLGSNIFEMCVVFYVEFIHTILRFTVLLIASQRLNSKVTMKEI